MAQKNSWSCFFLLTSFWAVGSVCAQDGFLSLSCGGKSNYTDKHGLSWTPDTDYTDTGNATTINLHIDRKRNSSIPARYFPGSSWRRCFGLTPNNVSSLVLVRAEFAYANYDGLADPPAFSVSLGTAVVAAVDLAENDPSAEEFVWRFGKEAVSFCLLGHRRRGSPVISLLEVRPLPERAYGTGMEDFPSKALRKSHRINCGYSAGTLRYPFDPYDRIWDPDKHFSPSHISTGFKAELGFKRSIGVKEKPPLGILETARVLARTEVLTYKLPLKKLGDYYVILYFAGILPVNPSFDILINGDKFLSNFTVKSSEARALYFTTKRVRMLNITLKSTNFYPQVNAIEVYEIIDIPSQASSTTVSALQVIQQSTGSDLGWKDDPCSPTLWDHIGCEGSLVTSLKLGGINLRSIIPTFGDLLNLKELDLHNTSLTGAIQNLGSLQKLEKLNLSFNSLRSFGSELESLISLRVLDLQNNTLKETVPDSLGELENLHFLNLENNKLQGTLPQALNKDSLEIRTSGNLCLSFSGTPCNDVSSNPSSIETPQVTILTRKKPHNASPGFYHLVVMIALIASALLAFFCVSLSIFFYIRKKKKKISNKASFTERLAIDMRNWNAEKVFTYKEIKSATNNFKEVIGRGSFGSVYFGKLKDGKLVAVKLRSDKSQLGADSFVNEVCLLSRIRHQNLVSMEGFCHELKHQILVYEYLPGGSLADHLYGTNSRKVSLSWVRRLKIAVDAAKGLDYLHNGTQPRIIHRDVKCSNILLDVEMNAKVCDFGLSKQVTQPDASHVTTVVKGTAGYLDPEYYTTQQLTEKSDVYSFGVVLLELICGREPLTHRGNPDAFNLVLWAKPYLQAGAFEIVDDSLKGSFDAESMRKAALIAVRSVERDASQRPKISHVLAQLKEAYTIQLSYLASRDM